MPTTASPAEARAVVGAGGSVRAAAPARAAAERRPIVGEHEAQQGQREATEENDEAEDRRRARETGPPDRRSAGTEDLGGTVGNHGAAVFILGPGRRSVERPFRAIRDPTKGG